MVQILPIAEGNAVRFSGESELFAAKRILHPQQGTNAMPLGTILLILLVLVLIGALLGAIAAPGDTALPGFSESFS